MALYHLSVKIITRADGQSACAAAAYRSAEKIVNEYDGITHDYRKKQNVEHSVVMIPKQAPTEYCNRETLWNAVEKSEKQANAQLAREIEFSLPRELPEEKRRKIAIAFIQEQFVDQGMIADVNFHNPPRMDSQKRTLDAEGNITTDPERFVYDNPHCHCMLTLRPMDEDGKWEPKKTKQYICEKNGIQKKFTARELKNEEGWEKLYHYNTPSGEKEWHTKSFVEAHPDGKYELVNRYPRCEQIINPAVEKWNSTNTLMLWREAWAIKVNEAFESLKIDERVDHRSYKDQGIELIPTIHEGKAITIAEKRIKEEYEQKVARGEAAELKHTEIRDLNNAIREHNNEIKIIAEMKKLREQMKAIFTPVMERIEALVQNFAESLERLRVEIISLTVKIRNAVNLKGKADEQIISKSTYIEDLTPVRKEKIEELQYERKTLKKQLEVTTGLLSGKKRAELKKRVESLDAEISLLKENRKHAMDAQKEIKRLQDTSDNAGLLIEQMQKQRNERVEEYSSIEAQIPLEKRSSIQMERMSIRSVIEQDYIEEKDLPEFRLEADKFDDKMGCIISELSIDFSQEHTKRKVKFASLD